MLEPRAAAALERPQAGAPFGAACAVFDDLPPADAAREATALLGRWLADGLVADAVAGGRVISRSRNS